MSGSQAQSAFLQELWDVAKTQHRRYPMMMLEDLVLDAIENWLRKFNSGKPNTVQFPNPDGVLSDDQKKFFAKLCHDILIDNLRRKAVEEADLRRRYCETSFPQSVDHAARVADRDELEHLLAKLSSLDQVIFKLHLFKEYTFREIALELKMSEATVRMRFHRALRSLGGVNDRRPPPQA